MIALANGQRSTAAAQDRTSRRLVQRGLGRSLTLVDSLRAALAS